MPDQDAADLKFRSGGVDAVDNVKPENYRWYEENQQKGNFTLHDVGASQATHLMWFNLNKVQPPVRGVKPTHGKKLGEPFVDPVKYAWFSNADFRRAVSMAIDREALIKGAFFGYGEKNWSQMTSSNKAWHSPDIVKHDYNPAEAKKLLAGMGFKDANGDGFLEDARGNPVSFMLKTNSSNTLRVGMANFIRDDLAKIGITDDADADRLQHAHHEHHRQLSVRGDPARVAEQRAADAVRRPERVSVVGRVAFLVRPAAEAGHAGGGAHRSRPG